MLGKSDLFVVVYIHPLFKVKQNHWEEPKSCLESEVWVNCRIQRDPISHLGGLHNDIGQDQRMSVAKLPLNELAAETGTKIELRLLPKLDMLKTCKCWLVLWTRKESFEPRLLENIR